MIVNESIDRNISITLVAAKFGRASYCDVKSTQGTKKCQGDDGTVCDA